ncbi:MAG: putative metal-binding motif-containing protein [Myxococcales bacterium]|nr:putative metal-binding motif-containing protein [Myxococcales bacterium]
MKRSTRKLVSYSALALGMSVMACGGDDGTSSSGGGGSGAVGATGGKGGTGGTGVGGVGNTGGGGTGNTGGGGTGNTGGGGTGGIAGGGGVAGGTGGGGTGGSTGTDADGDGYDSTKDCDDNNKDINPGATEVCNGVDDNCDTQIDEGVTSTFYVDADSDAYGLDNAATNKSGCAAPTGYTATKGDCDDADGAVYPGNTEVCDGKDNDCANGVDDGVTKNDYYNDTDGDGYGAGTATKACTPPASTWVTQGGDCNDADKAIFPGNTEICDGKDNDCNAATPDPGTQTWYQDSDGDSFGSSTVTKSACAQPTGYIAVGGDCNDADKTINPNAIELCDGKDNNCINGIDEGPTATWPDKDGDGFGDVAGTVSYLCAIPAGRAGNNTDCDDTNKAINPNATEIPGNKIDENCDGKDTAAGTQCGVDGYGASVLPYTLNQTLTNTENTAGNPAGATYFWDDTEVSTAAGQTMTMMYGRRGSSTIQPRFYTRPNSCTTGTITTYPYNEGNNHGNYKARRVISPTAAGYYYNILTTDVAGQTGDYVFNAYPGDLGGSCGTSTYTVWPLGWHMGATVSAGETWAAGTSPAPTGFQGEDVEFWGVTGTQYTILQGATPFADRVYVSKAGACATSLGVSAASSGVVNGGARLKYTPTSTGIYTAWGTATTAGQVGAISMNVVPGNVGGTCLSGAGPQGGTGDDLAIYPFNGTFNESLAIGDRAGDFAQRFTDDFETWMEAGDHVVVTVTRTGASTFTPYAALTSSSACLTQLAYSPQGSGAVATVTYTATAAGMYTLLVSSRQTNASFPYTVNMVLTP